MYFWISGAIFYSFFILEFCSFIIFNLFEILCFDRTNHARCCTFIFFLSSWNSFFIMNHHFFLVQWPYLYLLFHLLSSLSIQRVDVIKSILLFLFLLIFYIRKELIRSIDRSEHNSIIDPDPVCHPLQTLPLKQLSNICQLVFLLLILLNTLLDLYSSLMHPNYPDSSFPINSHNRSTTLPLIRWHHMNYLSFLLPHLYYFITHGQTILFSRQDPPIKISHLEYITFSRITKYRYLHVFR